MAVRGLIKKILNAERVQDHSEYYKAILKGSYINIIEANKKLRKEGMKIHGVSTLGSMLTVDVIVK